LSRNPLWNHPNTAQHTLAIAEEEGLIKDTPQHLLPIKERPGLSHNLDGNAAAVEAAEQLADVVICELEYGTNFARN
jgi:poly-gamma-glutamate capsule biosynthesis protein CapA/YwtB (metallophosphatase superfamily)